MRGPKTFLGLSMLCVTSSLLAQTAILPGPAAPPQRAAAVPMTGKALFHEKCAMCHGTTGMGTGLLARRMDPAVAELEKRSELTPDYVTTAARTGIGNMPAISRGEVSVAQMALIAAYLSRAKAR